MSTPWHHGRLCALDLETTSADPTTARIVSATVVWVGGGQQPESVDLLVNPGIEIPAEATAIHGITTERARAEGDEPFGALTILADALRKTRHPGGAIYPVVVFNARYDLTVLAHEYARHNVSRERGCQAVLPDYVVDPFVIDKHLDRYRPGSRRLAAMCAHYGAKLDAAHMASSDALAAARLAWVLAEKGQVVRRVRDEADMHELERAGERVGSRPPRSPQVARGAAHLGG